MIKDFLNKINIFHYYSIYFLEITVLYMLIRKTYGEEPGCNSLIGTTMFVMVHSYIFTLWFDILNSYIVLIENYKNDYVYIVLTIIYLIIFVNKYYTRDRTIPLIKKYYFNNFKKIASKKITFLCLFLLINIILQILIR